MLEVVRNNNLKQDGTPLGPVMISDMEAATEIAHHYREAKEYGLGLDSLLRRVREVLADPHFTDETARGVLQNILDGKDPV